MPWKPNQARGGASFDHLFNCSNSVSNNAALRTTLVSLDRSSYQVGDEPRFEVTVENLDPIPLRVPFSPHVADLQPEEPAEKFSCSQLQVELWIAGKEWRSNSGSGFSQTELAVVEATDSSLPAPPDLQTRESEAIKDGVLSAIACLKQLRMLHLTSNPRFEIPRGAGESIQNMTAQRMLGRQPRMVEIVAGFVCHT